eukprot:3219990-Karenia_brevis.AAC.1
MSWPPNIACVNLGLGSVTCCRAVFCLQVQPTLCASKTIRADLGRFGPPPQDLHPAIYHMFFWH